MIEIQSLEKSYSRRKVLRGLDLEVKPGGITVIAGPNACGKSTLMKCILGLVIPDQGRITVNGRTVSDSWEYRRSLGYMPQYPNFPPNLSLSEIMQMLEDLRGQRQLRADELLSLFEIQGVLKQPFGQLSGGTKQKAAAVIAFMFDAPVVVLDEPTAGLDPVSAVRFKDLLLRESSRGKTILMVSHSLVEMEKLARDLVYLSEGQTVFSGSIEQLKEREREVEIERAITHLMLDKNRMLQGATA